MQKVSELLKENLIFLNLKIKDKTKVIEQLAKAICEEENIEDSAAFLNAIMEREKLESTGIGLNVAIPHCRTDAVKKIVMAFGRSISGIDFKSLNGKPTHLIFLIAAPESEKDAYIKVLARISRLLRKDEFRNALMEAMTRGEIIHLFAEEERQ